MTYVESSTGKKEILFDVKAESKKPKLVRPLSEQGDLESRKVWSKCSEALNSYDYSEASRHKSEVPSYHSYKQIQICCFGIGSMAFTNPETFFGSIT